MICAATNQSFHLQSFLQFSEGYGSRWLLLSAIKAIDAFFVVSYLFGAYVSPGAREGCGGWFAL